MLSAQSYEAAFNEATALHERGLFSEAIARYAALRKQAPDDAKLAFLHGTALLQNNQLLEAQDALGCAIRLNDNLASAHNNLGMVSMRLEDWRDAIACFERALAIKPQHADALLNAGIAARKLEQPESALDFLNRLIQLYPERLDGWINLGLLLKQIGRVDEALGCYARAIQLAPQAAELHHNHGVLAMQLNQLALAQASLQSAVRLKPDYIEAWNSLGLVLKKMQAMDQALACYQQALLLQPDHAETLKNQGVLLAETGLSAEAIACFDRALSLKPDFAEALNNKGIVLVAQRAFTDAITCYDQALAIKPNDADVWWNKALCLLLTGQYLEGWRLYEWRCQKTDMKHMFPAYAGRSWRGQPLRQDQRLLVTYEQGFGDTVQFCRYLPLLAAQGLSLVFYVQQALATLLGSLSDEIQIVAKGEPLPDYDAYCPVMSLPMVFGTTVDTIPAPTRYLAPPASYRLKWQRLLGDKQAIRVGLVWSGSEKHKNDRHRSLPYAALESLLDAEVEWHSLQKEFRPNERELLDAQTVIRLHHNDIADFSDTAALIEAMDLVIAVDTSVAHVAAACGKPVWILLPYNPDYRWMLDSELTPWYPTARLFRQTVADDWASVLERVRLALEQVVERKSC